MNRLDPGMPIALPSPRALVWRVAGALLAATAITVLLVLPAEFGIDPSGLGKRTGLLELAATPAKPGTAVAHFYAAPWRSDVIDIPLKAFEELEYKVQMRAGETLLYSWSVDQGGLVYSDFHGESTAPGKPARAQTVQSYRVDGKEDGVGASSGALVAPFDGIHGWYWINLGEAPIVVHLRLSGYYRMLGK